MIGRGRDLSLPRDTMELRVKAHQPVRLDLYLREALVWKSRKRLQALIRSGQITVNHRQAKPSQAVRGGDRVQVRLSMGTGVPLDYGERQVEVIYEDAWLLAVNKPSNLLVHPVGRHVYDTLMNYLHHRYPPAAGTRGGGRRGAEVDEGVGLRLCHRIDKETTGIVLVAKESYVHRRLAYQFEHRAVEKEYLTLACGAVPETLAEIDLPIGEGGSLEEALRPPQKRTRTLVKVLERFARPRGAPGGGAEEFTLLSARPVTGRQNQIRVHLAAIGHAVAGDRRYGRPPPEGFPERYLLHARRNRFFHPRLKCPVELEAPPPEDFEELVERLRGGLQSVVPLR